MSGAGGAPLSAQQAQEVAVAAAREYLYSSSSLDDPSLAIAVECLGLAEGPDVRHERDVIEALRMLPALGVDLLPAQLKQVGARTLRGARVLRGGGTWTGSRAVPPDTKTASLHLNNAWNLRAWHARVRCRTTKNCVRVASLYMRKRLRWWGLELSVSELEL